MCCSDHVFVLDGVCGPSKWTIRPTTNPDTLQQRGVVLTYLHCFVDQVVLLRPFGPAHLFLRIKGFTDISGWEDLAGRFEWVTDILETYVAVSLLRVPMFFAGLEGHRPCLLKCVCVFSMLR